MGRAAGPAVLVVPLLLFVISVIWLATARPRPPGGSRPVPAVEIASVEGWTGASGVGAGPRVAARLTRLHADPRRQAFEQRAMAVRLGLGQGEPFRLELRAPVAGGLEHPAQLPLLGLAVHDEQGLALAPLPALAPLSDDQVADPLAVLLELPGGLEPGVTAGLVLWGRAPGAQARLIGSSVGEVALEPHQLVWHGVDEALASLERAPGAEEDGDGR